MRRRKEVEKRQESNFLGFRNFIAYIEMGEIKFKGDAYT